MSEDFNLGQGDTAPSLVATLRNGSGNLINLTGGATVVIRVWSAAANTRVVDGGACTILDAENGEVQYDWVNGDSANSGEHLFDFLVTYPNTSTETVPNNGNFRMFIKTPPGGS